MDDRSVADALMTYNHFMPVEGCFNVQHIEFDWDYCRPELDVQLNEALSSLTLCKRKPDGRPSLSYAAMVMSDGVRLYSGMSRYLRVEHGQK